MHYRLHGLTVTSDIALPEIRRSVSRGGSLAIELARAPADDPPDWFHSWRVKGETDRRPWLSFARRDGGYLLRFPDLADFEVSAAGDRIRCRPADRLAPSTLRHLLLDQVVPLALSQCGRLVLHASAVHVPGFGAVAFAGRAGCGKSTLAAAFGVRGCSVVTDDCVVIARGRHTLTALPGYPGLRLWRDAVRALGLGREAVGNVAHYTVKRRLRTSAVSFRDRPSPLRAIFVLSRRVPRGEPCRARALRPRDRLMALAPYAYVMDIGDRRQLSQMFTGLSTLVTSVPVMRLRVRDDRRRLMDAADEVLRLIHGLAIH